MEIEGRSLHRKLAEIAAAVGFISRDGNGPGYKFVSATAVTAACREEMASRHISLLPTKVEIITPHNATTISGKQATMTGLITWTLTDGDSGETATFMSAGSGSDSTDKSVGKFLTGSLKYALLLAFQVSQGEDPEADHRSQRDEDDDQRPVATAAPVVRMVTTDQLHELRRAFSDAGVDPETYKAEHGIDRFSTQTTTERDFSLALARLEVAKAAHSAVVAPVAVAPVVHTETIPATAAEIKRAAERAIANGVGSKPVRSASPVEDDFFDSNSFLDTLSAINSDGGHRSPEGF